MIADRSDGGHVHKPTLGSVTDPALIQGEKPRIAQVHVQFLLPGWDEHERCQWRIENFLGKTRKPSDAAYSVASIVAEMSA